MKACLNAVYVNLAMIEDRSEIKYGSLLFIKALTPDGPVVIYAVYDVLHIHAGCRCLRGKRYKYSVLKAF